MITLEQFIALWNQSNNIQKFNMLWLIGETYNDTRKVKDLKRNIITGFYRTHQKEVIETLNSEEIINLKQEHIELHNSMSYDEYRNFRQQFRETFLENNPQYKVLVF